MVDTPVKKADGKPKKIFEKTVEVSESVVPAAEASTGEVIIEVVEEVDRPDQIRDTVKNPQWAVVGSKHCNYTKAVIALLKEHGETRISIGYIEDDRRAYQNLTKKGIFYTPAVFMGGNLLGSYGDVESYYKRTFFLDDYNKIPK
jgi:hypothetical protein